MENAFPIYNTDYAKERVKLCDLKSVDINYGNIKKLASFGLSNKQLAIIIKVNYEKFKELLKTDKELENAISEGQSDLKLSILAGQLRMALPDPENGYIGNAAMLKRLGEVYLGQSEKISMDIQEDIHVVLKWAGKKNDEKIKEDDKDENS